MQLRLRTGPVHFAKGSDLLLPSPHYQRRWAGRQRREREREGVGDQEFEHTHPQSFTNIHENTAYTQGQILYILIPYMHTHMLHTHKQLPLQINTLRCILTKHTHFLTIQPLHAHSSYNMPTQAFFGHRHGCINTHIVYLPKTLNIMYICVFTPK